MLLFRYDSALVNASWSKKLVSYITNQLYLYRIQLHMMHHIILVRRLESTMTEYKINLIISSTIILTRTRLRLVEIDKQSNKIEKVSTVVMQLLHTKLHDKISRG